MNPAYLDYVTQMQGAEQEEQQQSPFHSGSQSALQAAKQSLGMDEDEKRRARGLAIMQLASHLGRPGYGSGARGIFNAVGQGILPAYQAYQGESNRVGQLNAYIQAQAQQAAERQRQEQLRMQMHQEKLQQRQQEQESLERHRNAQLGETQRYHQGKLGLEEKRAHEKAPQQPVEIGGHQFSPITTVAQKNLFTKEKKLMGDSLSELKEAQKQINEYKDLLGKREGFLKTLPHPVDPYTGSISRPLTDFAGARGWNKQLEKERVARKRLDSLLLRIRTSAERNLKGGVLAERMAQRFESKNALPSLNETMADLDAKMKDLTDEVSAREKAANLSLQNGVQITAMDLKRLEGDQNSSEERNLSEENQSAPQEEWIMMEDPSTGERKPVWHEDVATVEKQGGKRI